MDQGFIFSVVLAEFDIDKGAVVRRQFPTPLPVSESFLAEQMLPDGAHNRDEDWSMFLVRPELETADTTSESLMSSRSLKVRFSARTFALEEKEQQWRRLVPERPSETVILEQTLSDEMIFAVRNEEEECVLDIPLFLKSTPVSAVPPWSYTRDVDQHGQGVFCSLAVPGSRPLGLLFFSKTDEERFHARLVQMEDAINSHVVMASATLEAAAADGASPSAHSPADEGSFLYYALSYCNTRKDKKVRRGAIVRSLAFVSKDPRCFCLRGLLKAVLLRTYQSDGGSDFLPELSAAFSRVNAALAPVSTLGPESGNVSDLRLLLGDIERKSPDVEALARRYVHRFGLPPAMAAKRCVRKVELDGIFVRFPIIWTDGHVEDPRASLREFLESFREQSLVILHALLSFRKVVVLARQASCQRIAFLVLAAASCIPVDIDPGLLRDRVLPYVSLVNLNELTNRESFLAGVTNPMFEHHPEWWDVLCDADNGKVLYSNACHRRQPAEIPAIRSSVGEGLSELTLQPGIAEGSSRETTTSPLAEEGNEDPKAAGPEADGVSNWVSVAHSADSSGVVSDGHAVSTMPLFLSSSSSSSSQPLPMVVAHVTSNHEVAWFKQWQLRFSALKIHPGGRELVEDLLLLQLHKYLREFCEKSVSSDLSLLVGTTDDEFSAVGSQDGYIGKTGGNGSSSSSAPLTTVVLGATSAPSGLRMAMSQEVSIVDCVDADLLTGVLRHHPNWLRMFRCNHPNAGDLRMNLIRRRTDPTGSQFSAIEQHAWRLQRKVGWHHKHHRYSDSASGSTASAEPSSVPVQPGGNPLLLEDEILSILQSFLKFASCPRNILLLLTLFPHCDGGLDCIAACLFHTNMAVRLACVALLRRIDSVSEGKEMLSCLNLFLLLAYDEINRSMPNTELPK